MFSLSYPLEGRHYRHATTVRQCSVLSRLVLASIGRYLCYRGLFLLKGYFLEPFSKDFNRENGTKKGPFKNNSTLPCLSKRIAIP